jgi:hypothetical protein
MTANDNAKKRPCCATCLHWGHDPYSFSTCSVEMLRDIDSGSRPKTHAHFLCAFYRQLYPDSPPAPEVFSAEPEDHMREDVHQELCREFVALKAAESK